jgi:F-type H+-transporting ATPase subunit epsilon
VLPTKVTILAETAERAEEIDVERARRAKEAAEKMLHSTDPNTDFERALAALKRAEVRLDVATKRGAVATT